LAHEELRDSNAPRFRSAARLLDAFERGIAAQVEALDRKVAASYVSFVDAGDFDLMHDVTFAKLLNLGEQCAQVRWEHVEHICTRSMNMQRRTLWSGLYSLMRAQRDPDMGPVYLWDDQREIFSLPVRRQLVLTFRDMAARRADPAPLSSRQQQAVDAAEALAESARVRLRRRVRSQSTHQRRHQP
jgi:hypothetical protein